MSSDEELGGYAPTTPGPVQKKTAAPSARAPQRPVAGPSKPQPLKVGPPKKGARKESNVADTETPMESIMISSDEDNPTTHKTEATKTKGKATPPAVTHVNGNARTKGKAKGDPPQTTSSDAMDVDGPPVEDSEVVPAPPKSRSSSRPTITGDSAAVAKRGKREIEALKSEVERLRKRLDDANARNQKLSEQLERVMKIRETEPEEILRVRIEQYEATTRAQEVLIQEQTSQLAQLKVLGSSDQIHNIPFISREEAEAERKGLHNKVKLLNEAVKAKDAKIAELQTENKELRVQLEHEIKMAQTQSQQRANSHRNGPARDLNSDKKKDEVINLYERLTNVLVFHVEHATFRLHNLPEIRYKCLFTYIDDPSGRATGSDPCISFDLLDTWAREDGHDIDDEVPREKLEPKIMYTPRDLDKYTEEFRQKLGFFNDGFFFTPSQSVVFMKTLIEALAPRPSQDEPMSNTMNGQSDEQQEEDVVEVLVDRTET